MCLLVEFLQPAVLLQRQRRPQGSRRANRSAEAQAVTGPQTPARISTRVSRRGWSATSRRRRRLHCNSVAAGCARGKLPQHCATYAHDRRTVRHLSSLTRTPCLGPGLSWFALLPHRGGRYGAVYGQIGEMPWRSLSLAPRCHFSFARYDKTHHATHFPSSRRTRACLIWFRVHALDHRR